MAQHGLNSSEMTHLLIDSASTRADSPSLRQIRVRICSQSKHLCLPSKAAILILFWTGTVGVMYHVLIGLAAALFVIYPYTNVTLSARQALSYAILAFIMMFYPLSGYIADVCCGRLKTVVTSLVLLLTSVVLLFLGALVWGTLTHHDIHLGHHQGILVIILGSLSTLVFVIGLAGYQANSVQLGLDQLFEVPSQYLGLFIHYSTWAFNSGSVLVVTSMAFLLCNRSKHPAAGLLMSIPFVILLALIVLLIIGGWNRRWFYSEPGRNNPYKTVYDVIRFVKNHKHPLQRSAFTYSDNYIPSRLDFAKERYGGPFSTEQVEDLKTFMRILLILFAMGPAYTLEVPASFFVFPLFGLHSLHYYHHYRNQFCSGKYIWEILMESGSMMNIVTTAVLLPLYIWIIFSLLRRKVPKLFLRLGLGITICLLGIVSLLIVEVVGHSVNKTDVINQTHSQCVFQASLAKDYLYPTLSLNWSVLIIPSFCLGIGPSITLATSLEFISAQSPQSMKGLLVGVFFAIRGLFQFLNSIIIIPLSFKKPWASHEMIEHPPVTNCGFVYLLVTSVTGLIGLILFSVAAKRYKYRRRDEGWFRQHDVEEIYDRYLATPSIS